MGGLIDSFIRSLEKIGDNGFFAIVTIISILPFIACILLNFLVGYGRKYRIAVKKINKSFNENFDTINAINFLPRIPKEKYNQFINNGGNMEKYMTSEACVENPLRKSWMSSMIWIQLIFSFTLSIFASAYAGATGKLESFYAFIVLAEGVVFSVVEIVIYRSDYFLTMKAHFVLIRTLNCYVVAPSRMLEQEAVVAAEIQPAITFVPESAARSGFSDIDVGDMAPPRAIIDSPFESGNKDQKVRRVRKPAAQKTAEEVFEEPKAFVIPIPKSTKELLTAINSMSARGATKQAMREAAAALRVERAKPENNSSNTQKLLDEAFTKIITLMANS